MPTGFYIRSEKERQRLNEMMKIFHDFSRGRTKPYMLGDKNVAKRPEVRQKISQAKKGKPTWNTGKHQSEEWRKKLSISNLGQKRSIEARKKMSLSHIGIQAKEKHPNWKGGITPFRTKIYFSIEYRLWREAVFSRDNWTCQECGDNEGKNLNAHHIKSFKEFPELRTSIENGITLCKKCHIKKHKKTKINL